MPWIIHKAILDNPLSVIRMPVEAKILHIALQYGDITVWYKRPIGEVQMADRTFRIVATGEKVEDDFPLYLGTVQMLEGNLIWHVFQQS